MTIEDLPPIMSVEQFALWMHIARQSAYKAVRSGQVPGVVRIGKTLRIYRDAVIRWVEQGNVSLKRKAS